MNASSKGALLHGRTSLFPEEPGCIRCPDSLPPSHSAERQLIVVKWERTKGAKLAFSTWNKCYPRQSVHDCLPEKDESQACEAHSLRQH